MQGPDTDAQDQPSLSHSACNARPVHTNGSKTEVAALRRDVCFAPVSGHRQAVSACPKSANSRSALLRLVGDADPKLDEVQTALAHTLKWIRRSAQND